VTTSIAIRIRGRVQGVGYRPFVWRLADRFKILGSVCNDSRGVSINATGALLSDFIEALRTSAPPMARVASIEVCDCEPITAENFQIIPSRSSDLDITVTPDLATCAECRAEIFNTQKGLIKIDPYNNRVTYYKENPIYFNVARTHPLYKYRGFYYYYNSNDQDLVLTKVPESIFIPKETTSGALFVNNRSKYYLIAITSFIFFSFGFVWWLLKKRRKRPSWFLSTK